MKMQNHCVAEANRWEKASEPDGTVSKGVPPELTVAHVEVRMGAIAVMEASQPDMDDPSLPQSEIKSCQRALAEAWLQVKLQRRALYTICVLTVLTSWISTVISLFAIDGAASQTLLYLVSTHLT